MWRGFLPVVLGALQDEQRRLVRLRELTRVCLVPDLDSNVVENDAGPEIAVIPGVVLPDGGPRTRSRQAR